LLDCAPGNDGAIGFTVVSLPFVKVSLLAPVFGSVMPELTGGLFAPEAAAGPPKFGAGAVPPLASVFGPPTLGFTELGTPTEPGAVAIPPALVPPTLGLTAPAPVAGAGACAKATAAEVQTATDIEPAIIQEEILLLRGFDIRVFSSRVYMQ
jgi:hypothetical protein